jgi:tripeptidyl-peptidase-1
MKLGLAGTTFVFSSGDNGVAGNSGQCCTKAKCAGGTYNSGTKGTFNPAFPATCPYITSVGATQIKPNTAVTATNPEEACETVIYSGGGFSNVFAQPSYQSSAVASYYTNHKPTYTATQYNNSQTVRGYPDVAANGANYVVAVDGSLQLVYGTSASAPVFGSIITLINNQRTSAGKSAVGFINPVLYANPSAFTDITSGTNQGCGTNGFTAVSGWDPVTGLGTPIYSSLLKVFLALS